MEQMATSPKLWKLLSGNLDQNLPTNLKLHMGKIM